MECQVRGYGWLAHRFWGEYSATIGLVLGDEASAKDALAVLGPPWKLVDLGKGHFGANATFKGEVFEEAKRQLAAYVEPIPCFDFGCKGALHAIDSCAHSIDYGPRFNVVIPTVPSEQRGLWGATA